MAVYRSLLSSIWFRTMTRSSSSGGSAKATIGDWKTAATRDVPSLGRRDFYVKSYELEMITWNDHCKSWHMIISWLSFTYWLRWVWRIVGTPNVHWVGRFPWLLRRTWRSCSSSRHVTWLLKSSKNTHNFMWLVVWNIFYFPHILGIIFPTD